MLTAILPMLLQQVSLGPSHGTPRAAFVAPTVTTVRVAQGRILVDGRLGENDWTLAGPVTDLRQVDPNEGALVSERTDVRILYDGDALYVGARLFDREPSKIIRRLARRDASTHGDEFTVLIDSYHDHLTSFRFTVNPAGVKGDELEGGDGEFSDKSWDPVWEAATTVDSLGWTVEMRIPFTQLRFSGAREQMWGVRFEREIRRKNEVALFPFVSKTDRGLASRFGHLVGLEQLGTPRRLEVLPYALARGTYHQPKHADNPFDHQSSYVQAAGLDLKYGLRSNLTLAATVNPDFGQVEADPADVNLTAYETFFEEKRPFFVEGSNIFTFGGSGGGGASFSGTPQFYYSRRIGREPEGEPRSSGDYDDTPTSTTILGAAKLSGRTNDGWSVGAVEAVTAREFATVADLSTGARYRDEVEPLTNYFAGRVKRDLGAGNTTIGLLATTVHRQLDVSALSFLPSAAYAGGVDLIHRWGRNTYAVAASVGGSHLQGDTLAVQDAQRSSNRYYQRPDARSFTYQPDRTSLSGLTADLYLSKIGGPWRWSVAGSTTSPGFEVNDLGFQQRVDRLSAVAALSRRWTRVGRPLRQAITGLKYAPSWNYDGDAIERAVGVSQWVQYRNFWTSNLALSYKPQVVDDRLTRGGPLALRPMSWTASADLTTDSRDVVSGYVFVSYTQTAGQPALNILPQLTLRPNAAVMVSGTLGYLNSRSPAQYVQRVRDTTAVATLGGRYVFAQLHQQYLYTTVRANVTFSPVLSFELYAQPFAFAGDYSGFKELRARKTFDFNTYGRDNGSTITPGDTSVCYSAGPKVCAGVDPDGPSGPGESFALYNPDFRERSLKTNAVLRWEYRPGSTLFLVWTHSRSAYVPYDGSFSPRSDLDRATFRDRPTNILLVKLNYWVSL
jgi:Domain of unknown function (DUF5916)